MHALTCHATSRRQTWSLEGCPRRPHQTAQALDPGMFFFPTCQLEGKSCGRAGRSMPLPSAGGMGRGGWSNGPGMSIGRPLCVEQPKGERRADGHSLGSCRRQKSAGAGFVLHFASAACPPCGAERPRQRCEAGTRPPGRVPAAGLTAVCIYSSSGTSGTRSKRAELFVALGLFPHRCEGRAPDGLR